MTSLAAIYKIDVRRFLRFCAVGGSGVVVDMSMVFVLADPATLAWPAPLAKACAAEIAMLNNFLWNELWTFQDISRGRPGAKSRLERLIRFNLFCLGGLLLAVLILTLLHEWAGINLYLANAAAILGGVLWNYGMNAHFNWGSEAKDKCK